MVLLTLEKMKLYTFGMIAMFMPNIFMQQFLIALFFNFCSPSACVNGRILFKSVFSTMNYWSHLLKTFEHWIIANGPICIFRMSSSSLQRVKKTMRLFLKISSCICPLCVNVTITITLPIFEEGSNHLLEISKSILVEDAIAYYRQLSTYFIEHCIRLCRYWNLKATYLL